MEIAVRDYGGGNPIHGFGGGEQRWVANLCHFLRQEGHKVVVCAEGQDSGCDLFLDASWERCQRVKAPVHVHFSFFACNQGALQFPCIPSGKCNLAGPYKLQWIRNQNWRKTIPYNFTNLFIPQPYPDDLLPAKANEVFGFNRREILWATKDMFHPNFATQPRADGKEHVFPQGGIDTLKALIRLQEKADFKINFLMKHFLDVAPAKYGIPNLLSQIREKEFFGTVPWTQLLEIASRCKLNVPVGGLWGSIPESIYTKGLPMFYQRNCWSDEFGTILPFPELVDDNDIYDALETLWLDERVYRREYEIQQVLFEDHRTEGLRRNLKIAFEQLGF